MLQGNYKFLVTYTTDVEQCSCAKALMILLPTVPAFDGVSPDDWKSMLSRVELSDPSQMQMAGVISQMMAGVKSKTGSSSVMF